MKNIENLFNPDSCSPSAMPLTTALCRMVDQNYSGVMSEDMSSCMKKYSKLYERFESSLDDKQRKLFEKIGFVIQEPTDIDICEHFNKGFLFGVMLMTEILR